MRTFKAIAIFLSFSLILMLPGLQASAQKPAFGIHETVTAGTIPALMAEVQKIKGLRVVNDPASPILAFIPVQDSQSFKGLSDGDCRVVRSAFPFDKAGKEIALIAIRKNPVIINSDIQNTVVKGNSVELRFTLAGARKWAAMTKTNIGKTVAFCIDNQTYTLPMVNGEIRSGLAMFYEMGDPATARKISGWLNR